MREPVAREPLPIDRMSRLCGTACRLRRAIEEEFYPVLRGAVTQREAKARRSFLRHQALRADPRLKDLYRLHQVLTDLFSVSEHQEEPNRKSRWNTSWAITGNPSGSCGTGR